MKNKAFPAQNITQKPASIFIQNSLGVLVDLTKLKNVFRVTLNLPTSFYEIFYITEFYAN